MQFVFIEQDAFGDESFGGKENHGEDCEEAAERVEVEADGSEDYPEEDDEESGGCAKGGGLLKEEYADEEHDKG